MYRDERFQNVTARGMLRAILAAAMVMAGSISCAPDELDDGAPEEPLDESPNTPPGAPGEDVTPPAGEPAMPDETHVPGQLLVRFKSGTAPAAAEAVHARSQARVLHGFRVPSGLYLVELPEGARMEEAMAAYREDPRVLYARRTRRICPRSSAAAASTRSRRSRATIACSWRGPRRLQTS